MRRLSVRISLDRSNTESRGGAMSVQELLAVVPPPADPIDIGNADIIQSVQRSLGVALPSDLLDLSRAYGTGVFKDSNRLTFWVYNPFADAYLEKITEASDIMREVKEMEGDEFPQEVWPKVPGLLPCCSDDNGCEILFHTIGHPDSWPLILRAPRTPYYEQVDLPLSTFLAKVISRQIRCYLWADQPGEIPFFSDPVSFKQYKV
jgi:hypothetical protein